MSISEEGTKNDKQENETIKFVNDLIKNFEAKKKDEEVDMKLFESFGIVVLKNGSHVFIKNYFYLLKVYFKSFKILEIDKGEEYNKFLKETGGLFDNMEYMIPFTSIDHLIDPNIYYGVNKEEKKKMDMKTAMMNVYIDKNFFSDPFRNDNNEEDDE